MDRAYWEAVAADYEGSVLSVFDHDVDGAVQERIERAADPAGAAADLGCGVGKFTPLLARCFGRVLACDLTAAGVAATRERCREFAHVDVRRHDLARGEPAGAPVDFVLCVNVLIMPALDARRRAWRSVTNVVQHGGSLVLVVPSAECAQFTQFRELERCLDEGWTCAQSVARSSQPGATARDLSQGIHRLRGLRTKHYLRDELAWLLTGHEMDVREITRLRYAADAGGGAEEGQDAAPVAAAWDWLVVAQRR